MLALVPGVYARASPCALGDDPLDPQSVGSRLRLRLLLLRVGICQRCLLGMRCFSFIFPQRTAYGRGWQDSVNRWRLDSTDGS